MIEGYLIRDSKILVFLFKKKIVTRCWAFVVLVCVGTSQTTPLSVLARNPHKGPLRETGSGREEEVQREARRTVNRRSKETTVRR